MDDRHDGVNRVPAGHEFASDPSSEQPSPLLRGGVGRVEQVADQGVDAVGGIGGVLPARRTGEGVDDFVVAVRSLVLAAKVRGRAQGADVPEMDYGVLADHREAHAAVLCATVRRPHLYTGRTEWVVGRVSCAPDAYNVGRGRAIAAGRFPD